MSDKFLPDVSVGDFALDILKSMAKDPNALKPALKESTMESANAPDVSRIKVSEDFVAKVTGGKAAVKEVKPKVRVQESSQSRLENLVTELSSLIGEARSLLEDMTSTGNIGCGSSYPVKRSNSGKKLLMDRVKKKLKR